MTWHRVQQFIDKHSLPYRILRFNMSLAGCLTDTFTDEAVAFTAKDAMTHLKGIR